MSNPVNLFVHLPPASRYMLEGHDFPVLVHVDPHDATVSASIEGDSQGSITWNTQDLVHNPFNGFNKIVRINGLPDRELHCLYITAVSSDGSKDPAGHCCGIRRDPSTLALRKRKGRGKQKFDNEHLAYGGAPSIVYPTGGNVGNCFTAYGYVTPSTSAVTAWVADPTNGQTYPGIAVQPPPPYDWAFSFVNLPLGAGQTPVGCTLYAQANSSTSNVAITVNKT